MIYSPRCSTFYIFCNYFMDLTSGSMKHGPKVYPLFPQMPNFAKYLITKYLPYSG